MNSAAESFVAGHAAEKRNPARRRFHHEGFEVEVVDRLDALDAIAAEWRALEQRSHQASVFQSFSLLRVWAEHFCSGRNAPRLHVVVVRAGGRTILILPLTVSGLPFMRVARMAGDPVTQFSEVLVDPSAVTAGAFRAALHSARTAGIDAITFRRVRADSNLLDLGAPFFRPPSNRSEAPFLDLSQFADMAAFRASLSKKMRQGLRNRRNHLEKAGSYRFEIVRGTAARAIIAEALDLKRKWLIQRGAISSAFVDPATKACLLDIAERTESSVVARLEVEGATAAIRFGFEYRGTHFAYLSAYDSSFADLSPGKLLMEFCISGFRERSLDRVDMLPPGGRHKNDWCAEETEVADYTVPLSKAGRLYAETYQENVRPALKRAWQNMPDAVRSLATLLLVRL